METFNYICGLYFFKFTHWENNTSPRITLLLMYLGYITLRVGCWLRENATIIFIKTTWWRLRTLNNELWISLLWNLMRHSWASFPRHLLAKKAKPFHTSVSNSNYPNLFLSLPTLTYYGCCCLHTKHRLRTSGMTFFHEKIGIIYRLKQIHIAVSLS